MRLTDLELTEEQVAELGAVLRGRLPEVAAEAILEVEAQVPAVVRPHDPRYAAFLGQAVRWGIGRFVELLAGGDARLEELHGFYRELGVMIAEEGIPQESWQSCFRVATGVAINRLTEAVGTHPGVTPTAIARVAQDVLYYLEQITGAMNEGYAGARSASDTLQYRRKLLDLLISDDPRPEDVHQLALDADWPVPRTIAAVALRPHPDTVALRPVIPADALPGLHHPEPCLIIPDPAGPGHRQRHAAELRDWIAAVGPTVGVTRAAESLRWARRTLDLAAQGHLGPDRLIHAGDHTLPIVLLHGGEMMDHLTRTLLAPVTTLRKSSRRPLMETLLRCLQCGFNATEVAVSLNLHPQSIRYRIRQLEDVFGPTIRDPERNLEYQSALTYWLRTHPHPQNPTGTPAV
ncbi:helix-turn-helix domain-containing protein [Actinocorallia sp. API 0066]|uniref:PucR family transcriptional regulator n=1 Tax=Actinocorallia sp. API 0066 TaxID=2896846 RepID=UPI001E4AD501|nr:PucR family transcriptional regulator [Actinocorallia sp. API 0066]MCD0449355.1 helix-turn-helix domain-containing protein [Actinocorallia sp. API 0066]